jgi:hypothetical protein
MTVTARAAELTLLFVLDVLVLLARTGGTVAEGGGVAITTFAHENSPSFENRLLM